MKYTLKRRRGIDDLKGLYAFTGNSQGDHSCSNDIRVFEASGGWMSYNFKYPMTQTTINEEVERRKKWNEQYISQLKKEGRYGEEFEVSITMEHDPIWDSKFQTAGQGPVESYRMEILDLSKTKTK